MNEKHSSMIDSARRRAEQRHGHQDTAAQEAGDGPPLEAEGEFPAFSILSADRQQKLMVDFRFLNGNAKALSYSYLVACDLNPSKGIELDFSGYTVTLAGRNLRPVYDALVSQRCAVVREMDDLHAEADLGAKATVVTKITIKKIE